MPNPTSPRCEDQPPRSDGLTALPDVALRLRVPYAEAYKRMFRGDFGPVTRLGSRLFVRLEAGTTERSLPPA